ncbi:MAG: selenocysteine-specific translation elongation factor, partial [Phycisphaerae bacterium]
MPNDPAAPPATRYRILGTAGHIDHGKSRLVQALTGTDPDRLPEEQARGMTIELGFAHLDLPGRDGQPGVRLGIVDVPGHERFVRTMVAGATGIDLGLLVVAADDGVMPQTREHAEILHLLGVAHGVVAINKADLVDDERCDAVAEQIVEMTAGTPLHDWPIVRVSAATGSGLDALRDALADVLSAAPDARESAVFRLAIDRVFAVRGRGTVVTGSVLSGTVEPGATLALMPAGLTGRVREIQSHGTSAATVRAGQRAALNLTGIDRARITRGAEMATPRYLTPSRYVDANIHVSSRRERPLASFRRARVEMATWEHVALIV